MKMNTRNPDVYFVIPDRHYSHNPWQSNKFIVFIRKQNLAVTRIRLFRDFTEL
jgi:hypothetical protein